ncbi:1-deoxy-D-xylulose-5-phosphate reductoisomerase [Oceanibaculum nanhaiense]|jgi:1-deoxy-D-xylulose-5-phosphate reductoisomerase|uniref:1-deoxy-D-xylulose-5-phosphate reductoisomerase n=1 Tax=Oceanibaculum nanhaiense TaxID=1909734 RepID=UPI000A3A231A|nr:1-deoxy-D-xylulose-5-phosphate reductoisomerase [Oceanibaculum nanhaiense]
MAINNMLKPGEPRHVTVLGSTGSVGCNTVDLLLRDREAFTVEALAAGSNVTLLIEQALALRPAFVAMADPSARDALEAGLAGTGIAFAVGPEAVIEAAERPSDWVMAAIVGAAGLSSTLAAIRRGVIVAVANKECLVCAGDLVMAETKRSGATLLPVDSEHSAIYQVFDFAQRDSIERIILTASGGPFREADLAHMRKVTPAEAVAHPNWSMGAKISIDSATMMNKGLELIEAHYLFDMPESRIDVLVHPQSVIHSMVSYIDGSVLAQLGSPDMRTPIAYALGWPRRIAAPAARLDLAALSRLTFEQPDPKRFPALRLARTALQSGGGAPTILNAANEVAVRHFLERNIGFLDIADIVEETLSVIDGGRVTSLAEILELDRQSRDRAGRLVERCVAR